MHILDPDPGGRYCDLHVRRGGERHAGRRTQRGKIRKKNKQERERRKKFGWPLKKELFWRLPVMDLSLNLYTLHIFQYEVLQQQM